MRALLDRGEPVVSMDAFSPSDNGESGLTRVVADIRDREAVSTVIGDHRITRIAHLAGIVDTGLLEAQPGLGIEVNVLGAECVLAAAVSHGVSRLVLASSRAVYGPEPAPDTAPPSASEEDPANPVFVYDVCKAAAEGIVRAYRRNHGLDATAIRFSTIYGPGKTERHTHASIFSALVEGAASGEAVRAMGARSEEYDLIYVEDAALGVVDALFANRSLAPVYNISTGIISTLGEFVEAVNAVTGVAVDLVPTESNRIRYRYPLSNSRAKSDLGYRPRYSLNEGVADYVRRVRTRSA